MTPEEVTKALLNSINTLNTISVRGEEDMNHLLGVILYLKQIIPEIDKFEVKEDETH